MKFQLVTRMKSEIEVLELKNVRQLKVAMLEACGLSPGQPPAWGVAPGGSPLAVIFPAGATLQLDVTGEDGRPVAGASAMLRKWQGRDPDGLLVYFNLPATAGREAQSDETGALVLGPLAEGEAEIEVTYQTTRALVRTSLRPGQTTRLPVRLASAP